MGTQQSTLLLLLTHHHHTSAAALQQRDNRPLTSYLLLITMSRFITAKMAFPMLMVLMSMMMMLATRSVDGIVFLGADGAGQRTCVFNDTNAIGFYEATESAFQLVPADNSGVIPLVNAFNSTYVVQPGLAGPNTARLFEQLPEGGFQLIAVCTNLYYAPDRASCSKTIHLGEFIFQGIFDQNCAVTGMVGQYSQPPGPDGIGGIDGTANGEIFLTKRPL